MIYYAYNYYLCNKIKHAIMTTPLQERLFALQDKQYAAFQAKLTPGVPMIRYRTIEKLLNILASIICFIFFCIYNVIDYFNSIFQFTPNIPNSFISEEKWRKRLRKLFTVYYQKDLPTTDKRMHNT